jgi:hypothetical protein
MLNPKKVQRPRQVVLAALGRPAAAARDQRQVRSAHQDMSADDDSDPPDEFVPDPIIWKEFGITPMTGWRWTNDPDLGFPRPVKIRNRCFRSRNQIEAFKARMLSAAIAARVEA